jgi:uncharacterized protein (DUF885 family)
MIKITLRHCSLLVLGLVICCKWATAQSEKTTDTYYFTGKVHPLMAQFEADRGSLLRFYTVVNSPERRDRLTKFYQDNLNDLKKLSFDKLPVSDQVDYILFKRTLDDALRLLSVEENEFEKIRSYIPFSSYIYQLEKIRRRGANMDAKEVAMKLTETSKQVQQSIKGLKDGSTMEKNLADRAEAAVKGLDAALRSVYNFYNGYDPQFSWWVPEPYKELDSLLNLYAGLFKTKIPKDNLQKDDGSGIVGNPIGKEELIRQLRYEMISYSPEELIDIANKEFAWCDKEMLKASKEMGFGDDWKKALEKIKNTYVPEGKQPEMILGLYNESIEFIKKQDLVTIPPIAEETWRMVMMSPEQQLIAPFFLGGETLLISYPTNTMEQEDKMMSLRGNNPHFSRAVVHHELIAGHHLQGFMNNRYKSYRNFRTPFWSEGWALYWEMILWDLNFPRSPEDRVGMLFWRMHRCARIIFSLNYHLGKWTPQQCIDFLVDRVGHERANAAGEVRRSFTGNYGPLYQLAYMMGAIQFYSLKKELVDSRKMSFKQFHDTILKENNMPVEMVRALLLNKPLKADYTTNWKFYDR